MHLLGVLPSKGAKVEGNIPSLRCHQLPTVCRRYHLDVSWLRQVNDNATIKVVCRVLDHLLTF